MLLRTQLTKKVETRRQLLVDTNCWSETICECLRKWVERLKSYWRRYFFHETSVVPPLESNFGIFEVFSISYLSSWIDRYVDSVNWLNNWKVIVGGNFFSKIPLVLPCYSQILKFFKFPALLVKKNRSVSCLWKSAERLKSYC